jgi:hypothetical protein
MSSPGVSHQGSNPNVVQGMSGTDLGALREAPGTQPHLTAIRDRFVREAGVIAGADSLALGTRRARLEQPSVDSCFARAKQARAHPLREWE